MAMIFTPEQACSIYQAAVAFHNVRRHTIPSELPTQYPVALRRLNTALEDLGDSNAKQILQLASVARLTSSQTDQTFDEILDAVFDGTPDGRKVKRETGLTEAQLALLIVGRNEAIRRANQRPQ